VFSPERVLTGRIFSDLARYPKLLGGLDDKSARRGIDFYTAVLDFDQRDGHRVTDPSAWTGVRRLVIGG
jgi:UDP-N-acetyl-D-mannosaminuronate dehydrogenase